MVMSQEKLLRGRAGTQTALWEKADSWLGPLREYAKVSAAIRFWFSNGESADAIETVTEAIEKRLQFLAWEATSSVVAEREQGVPASEALLMLFFDRLGFQIVETGADPLLDVVLGRRRCPPRIGAMLFAWMAELVAQVYGEACDFKRVHLIESAPSFVVRFLDHKESGAVDLRHLGQRAQRVREEEWTRWCFATAGFPRLSWVQGLVGALQELQSALLLPVAKIVVLDQLIALQPSQTKRWAERALLHQACGESTRALEDLKRFFAFNERESAPATVVALYDSLLDATETAPNP